ncbi:MAG: UDP-N-acetylglucosamine 1-carboxyvinyltransferase [Oscillospiraceae bacterium]|nr:UDP-N-acetylglucosamine 1-carboxyvinyltransferase [Oscillospiraceae bacterium]
MSLWTVHGGNRLCGTVKVQGSKNAVLPILAASLLTKGETVLENCPALLDVDASLDILRHLGCRTAREGDTVTIDSAALSDNRIPHELMGKMRSSVTYMGAILARTGEVRLSRPGGCELGSRPIDLHLKALRALGAEVDETGGEVYCRAEALHGTYINLDFPSVGATENIMLAACAAEGTTTVTNAAREPEIYSLQDFLNAAGAKIHGAGTSTVVVEGFTPRGGVRHRIMSDRIAAATLTCACAAAGGEVELRDVRPEQMETVLSALREMGCGIVTGADCVHIRRQGALKAGRPIITKPYPGFPTDAQALLMAACLKAEGTSVFVENIFESRYRHVDELRRLGADIRTEGRVAMVYGVPALYGAHVTAGDLRGGAAMVIAGLSAEGETAIHDVGHILRGYAGLNTDLQSLGGSVILTE